MRVIGLPAIASLSAVMLFSVVNSFFNFYKVYFISSLLIYTIKLT